MENSKNLTGAGAVIVSVVTTVIVLGLGWLFGASGGSSVTYTAVTPAQQSAIEQHVASLLVPLLPKSGALASPAIGPWFSYGDIIHDGQSADVTFTNTATSSACSILSPAATSTLSRATLRVATEPYANTWKIFRASTPTTQTTLLASGLVGTTGSIIATTSVTALTDGVVLPSSYINFVVATTTTVNANFSAVVHCEAAFIEL